MNNQSTSPKQSGLWVGVDWGTTNIRAYLIDPSGEVLSEHSLARHIKDCSIEGWPIVLEKLLEGWPVDSSCQILVCGMAGSKFGWVEAPYVACPAGVNDLVAKIVHPDGYDNVSILPGLSCHDANDNHDVIRGEETQLLGLFEKQGIDSGLICAPGTHTKWIWAENGTVERFHTTMTGELFGLLVEHSILAQSVDMTNASSEIGHRFEDGVKLAARGEGLLANLFKVRANGLFDALSKEDAGDFLSGILVGADVSAEMSKQDRAGATVPLVGPKPLSARYAKALAHYDVECSILDAEAVTVAGLCSIARQMGLVG